jgi:hypothetical protein
MSVESKPKMMVVVVVVVVVKMMMGYECKWGMVWGVKL